LVRFQGKIAAAIRASHGLFKILRQHFQGVSGPRIVCQFLARLLYEFPVPRINLASLIELSAKLGAHCFELECPSRRRDQTRTCGERNAGQETSTFHDHSSTNSTPTSHKAPVSAIEKPDKGLKSNT
jgi:hypothetical protein